jgi:hypothetical protein
MTPSASWPLAQNPGNVVSMLAIRPNGAEVLLLGDGSAYVNGRALPPPGIVAYGNMSATDDGRTVYTIDTGNSPASQTKWTLDYSEIAGGVLFAAVTNAPFFSGNESNGKDVAVAGDGNVVYFASGAPYSCVSLNPVDLSFLSVLPGDNPYPNNVEVTWDKRVICGFDDSNGPSDFWVYATNGAVQTYKVAGYNEALLPHQLAVTADGYIVIATTGDPALAFVPIGP